MNPSCQSTLENWTNGLCLLFSVLLNSQKNIGLFHKTTQSGLRLLYVTCYRCTGMVGVRLCYIYLTKHENLSIKGAILTVVLGHAHICHKPGVLSKICQPELGSHLERHLKSEEVFTGVSLTEEQVSPSTNKGLHLRHITNLLPCGLQGKPESSTVVLTMLWFLFVTMS